jgi:DNA-binding LacI/PurR family transcriptional regulator
VTVEESATLPQGAVATSPPPATLAEVAHLAGVSLATASRVLTGSARVRPQTRNKVEQAIKRVGYVRNRAARSVSRPQTGSVALVVCEDSVKVFAEPFFARILRSVGKAAAAASLQHVLLTLEPSGDYRTLSRYLHTGAVDGVLFASIHNRPDFDFSSLGLPLVLCGRPMSGTERLSYVDADNVEGARKAVRYLLDHGRVAVATIAGPPDMSPGVDRLLGYRQVMTDAGRFDPGLVAYGDFSRQAAEHALARLLDHRPKLDAVFAASDLMAAGAIRVLRRCGRRVPDDVAVIGFEDSALAQHTDPRLSTIHQPVDAMASRMVRELLSLITNPGREPSHTVMPTELVRRESA